MRIAFVSGYYDPDLASPIEAIERYYTTREIAERLAAHGHDVSVWQHFREDTSLERNGVRYSFLRAPRALGLLGRMVGAVLRDWPYPYYQLATRLSRQVTELQPDVIHFWGLGMDLNLRLIARTARASGIPLVVHYHGGGPPREPIRRAIARRNVRDSDRLLFTTRSHADPYAAVALSPDDPRVVEFMETSTTFRQVPREVARERTGMHGHPVFVSTGRLHPVKDPLTLLRGFAGIAEHWREARLYLFYLTDQLLPQVKEEIDRHPDLGERVRFRGRVPLAEMEAVYSSADFFLQASRREFSGCAVLEAMACGAIPIVSDIPSFRRMTGDGRFGVLFPVEAPAEITRRALEFGLHDLSARSLAIRSYFERTFGFDALTSQLEQIYRDVIRERSSSNLLQSDDSPERL